MDRFGSSWPRSTVVVVLVVSGALVAVPALLRTFDGTRVTFESAASPTAAPEATSTSTPTASAEVSPSPPAAPRAGTVGPGELGSPVLAYGPFEHDWVYLFDGDEKSTVLPGTADVVLPDRHGLVVVQPGSAASFRWADTSNDGRGPDDRPVVDAWPRQLQLRSVLPDGRVVYSVRPEDEKLDEPSIEEFFTIAPVADATPEPIGTRPAYESWTVGPARAADGRLVWAHCHLHCNLWAQLDAPADEAEPLYRGLAIEGLSATPDGRIIGFVEYDAVLVQQGQAPQLVLLDGATFAELARIDLPVDNETAPGGSAVSLSADGQRVLVTLGSVTSPKVKPYLVRDALMAAPQVLPVDFVGTLRWFDPAQAVGRGTPGAQEVQVGDGPGHSRRHRARHARAARPFRESAGRCSATVAGPADDQHPGRRRRLVPAVGSRRLVP